jgi:hypothetical protein
MERHFNSKGFPVCFQVLERCFQKKKGIKGAFCDLPGLFEIMGTLRLHHNGLAHGSHGPFFSVSDFQGQVPARELYNTPSAFGGDMQAFTAK